VDSTGLGILNTNILGGSGTNLDATVLNGNTIFLAGGTQAFTFNLAGSNKTVTINGGTSGINGQQAVDQFNQQLTGDGITAMIDSNGRLQFFGEQTAFTVTAGAAGAGTAVQTAAGTASNANLAVDGTLSEDLSGGTGAGGGTMTFMVGTRSVSVDVSNLANTDAVRDKINSAMNSYGVFAVEDPTGTMIKLQGTSDFTYAGSTTVVYAAAGGATVPTTNSATQNSLDAISALQNAVNGLGAVQGTVGTGQNQLTYAVQLAQSQITSFSAAESRIRDTDVAAEAANLTKAQVLQQTSIAAMAQANSAPQAIMALLRG
jgi:flagellin